MKKKSKRQAKQALDEIERILKGDEKPAELAARPFTVAPDELPDDVSAEAVITDADINRAIRKARKSNPLLADLLGADLEDDDSN